MPEGRSERRHAILVFAKAPVAGTVKTRLAVAIGDVAAARLHERLLARTLATACDYGQADIELWCTPDRDHPAFTAAADRWPLRLQVQSPGDLGTRMHRALDSALARYRAALLIGCDCPPLTAGHLADAFGRLERDPVVIGPAEDGGYMLLGARRNSPTLFDGIEWGGPRVLAQTRMRLCALGWRWHELAPLWDLDRPDDLQRLAELGLSADRL